MVEITFNAFSFLRKRLKDNNIPYVNHKMRLEENCTPQKLVKDLGYDEGEVEFVFINGKVAPFDTLLKDGDRVAIVPPGTPGSYRLILGAKKVDNQDGTN